MANQADSATPVPPPLAAALAGRYDIERELGRGGMATVWLARDLRHSRPVALKVLHANVVAGLGPQRFLREITLTAGLHHPHILPLLDSGEAAGLPYYVMPLVEGESLRQRLEREQQLPLEEALQITLEVADALSYAHSRGIVHRDIKPENILLESGHALVADFGIARAVDEAGAARLTETGLAIGTPAYMSPEQAMGEATIDARTDVYSLGCVLYEMLTGETPWSGASPHAILARKLSEPLPRVSVVRETVPPALERAVTKALARAPADRFPTVSQFAGALRESTAPEPGVRAPQRYPWQLGAAVLAAAVLVAAFLAVFRRPPGASGPEAGSPVAIPIDTTAIAVLPFRVIEEDSTGSVGTLAWGMGHLVEAIVTGEYGVHIRHPGSVAELWRDAGGAPDTALSEAAELSLARTVGAGRLMRGTAIGRNDSLWLSASLVDVETGTVRVPVIRVAGPVAGQLDLVNELVNLVLAREAVAGGAREWQLPATALRLGRHRPEAVQAFLAALRRGGRRSLLKQALALDSTLVEAAFYVYRLGERPADTAELRYAWEHRAQLPERMQAYLEVLAAGRHGPVHTRSQVIGGYEALARRWPEDALLCFELTEKLALYGRLTGEPTWLQRALDARRRNQAATGSVGACGGGTLLWADLAFEAGDTAQARAVMDSAATRGRSFLLDLYRWRLAAGTGDTAGQRSQLAAMAGGVSWAAYGACQDGVGIRLIDQLADTLSPPARMRFDYSLWGWVRGREAWWRSGWREDSLSLQDTPPGAATVPVYRALVLGMPADSSVASAVRYLDRLARDRSAPAEVRAQAVVWSALWAVYHGAPERGGEAVGFLQGLTDRPYRFAGWVGLFRALETPARSPARREALLALDSAVKPVPLGLEAWRPEPTDVQNLLLARMWRELGEAARGLAASRRRQWCGYYYSWPEYLREEGRLAAEAGDTAGALAAYGRYLRLREDPDPLWRAAWDSVRAERAALAGRRG